jgi:ubiquitin carboxyl-terminal hydrolase 34
MDHQPLNTGEQKDMAEFFIDLVSKLEEMTPELQKLIKTLFCGVTSNNVVSLDCPHVSRTLEEFYTVRCQVSDMRTLYDSLNEVTVKDTLEGDNMYTCSQCGKKVRAEKRACFKKLPKILAFNTMRYTFNMITMMKEKVNTHFSFPLHLDMSEYVEKTLMPQQYQGSVSQIAHFETIPILFYFSSIQKRKRRNLGQRKKGKKNVELKMKQRRKNVWNTI